jgi:muconolactone delta-isomerase
MGMCASVSNARATHKATCGTNDTTFVLKKRTDEMLALLPAETARGKELDAAGSHLALYLAADLSTAWQVYQAEALAEVQEMVASFPLSRFVTSTIIPLQAGTA